MRENIYAEKKRTIVLGLRARGPVPLFSEYFFNVLHTFLEISIIKSNKQKNSHKKWKLEWR